RLERPALGLGEAPDRRPADGLVDVRGARGPAPRDELRDELPQRPESDADDLGVGEELVEEGLELLAPLRAAELHEQDAGLHARTDLAPLPGIRACARRPWDAPRAARGRRRTPSPRCG